MVEQSNSLSLNTAIEVVGVSVDRKVFAVVARKK